MHFTCYKNRGPGIRFTARWFAPLFMALALVQAADAKCAYSFVTIAGRSRNLQGQVATITVMLRTPKGDYTKEGDVADGPFSVNAPFDTYSSSGFFGDKCKNRPATVRITIRAGEKLLLDQQVRFEDAFERDPRNKFAYRLKHAIEIDAARSSEAP